MPRHDELLPLEKNISEIRGIVYIILFIVCVLFALVIGAMAKTFFG